MESSNYASGSESANEVHTTNVVDLGDDDQVSVTVTATGRKRQRTSEVWKDFIEIKEAGKIVAQCKHCKKKLVGGSSAGTTHLRKHLFRCPVKRNIDPKQQHLSPSVKHNAYKFDQEDSRMDLARMIIKHKYPFNIANHEFFEIFCNGLNPNFKIVSRNTVRADVLQIYEEEKGKLYKFLEELSCKITITTDIWTSDHQNFAYTCLTAHYIDDNWDLKKKILNYRYIEYPHDGETLFRFISELILAWNLDTKLCAMVVDNASANDSMVRHMKSWLKSLLSLGGDLFHVRCSAHILNLIVQDGLKVIGGLLDKIRDTVRYLSRSPFGKQKFDIACKRVKLHPKKKVPMDVPNRWNSTYLMLEAALELKEAFLCLDEIDANYKHNPFEDEWEVAYVVKDCLKIFYDATCLFSGTNFPTANIFFGSICEIQDKLNQWENSSHTCLRVMVIPMKEKFEKYWDECSLLLAIAVVLDPRFKMDLVEFYYMKLYGSNSKKYVDRVESAFGDLFIEYKGNSTNSDCGSGSSNRNLVMNTSKDDNYSEFDYWRMSLPSNSTRARPRTELQLYLEEPVFPRSQTFNILRWWKVNSPKFPTLAKMARDLLAVPVTTIASESAFSIGGRVIDESRASLAPDIVEALIATDDWIESPRKSKNVEESSSGDLMIDETSK